MKQPLFRLLPLIFLSFFWANASATSVQAEIEVPKEILYRTAKAYILSEFSQGKRSVESVIPMEDARAGILRFRFRDGSFADNSAVLEVIDLEPTRSRLRVTIPKDFNGRDQLMVDQIRRVSLRRHKGKEGKEIPYEGQRVFQSVLRFVLKEFVSERYPRSEVVMMVDEGAGYLQFVYREGRFRDPKAQVQIIPLPGAVSRLVVLLPMDPTIRQPVLENRLIRAITADLGERKEKKIR